MGSHWSSCRKYICCCCRSKEDEEKKRLRKRFRELYYETENRISPSSPSTKPTENITAIYESQSVDNDNKLIEERGYNIVEVIPKGGTGVAYKAVKTKESDRKIIERIDITLEEDKADNEQFAVKNELFIIQMTNHPNIVRVYDYFMIKRPKTLSVFIITDYAENTLFEVLRNPKITRILQQPIFQRMFAQMVSAVRHMHRNGIAHRDLKMNNILIDDSHNVLVTDFGLRMVAHRPSKGGIVLCQTYTGTPAYMAPEIVRCSMDSSVPYDPFIADIWALGVILYCMINKRYPFNLYKSKDVFVRLNEMKNIKFRVTSNHKQQMLFEEYIDIQKRLLEFDVKKRITSEQLAKHPWISDRIDVIEKQMSKH